MMRCVGRRSRAEDWRLGVDGVHEGTLGLLLGSARMGKNKEGKNGYS